MNQTHPIFSLASLANCSSLWGLNRIYSARKEMQEACLLELSLPNSLSICKEKLLYAWIHLQTIGIEEQKVKIA